MIEINTKTKEITLTGEVKLHDVLLRLRNIDTSEYTIAEKGSVSVGETGDKEGLKYLTDCGRYRRKIVGGEPWSYSDNYVSIGHGPIAQVNSNTPHHTFPNTDEPKINFEKLAVKYGVPIVDRSAFNQPKKINFDKTIPTRTISDAEDEAWNIVAMEDEHGNTDFNCIWLEIDDEEEDWDNEEWLLKLFDKILNNENLTKKEFKKVIKKVLYMDKKAVKFVVKHRKGLTEAIKYIQRYW